MKVRLDKNKPNNSATRRRLAIALVLLLGFSIEALAECSSPLPPSVLPESMREFYTDVCRESDSPLVFAQDPEVKSRLQLPSGGHRLNENQIYPDSARRVGFEGSVIVAFVVELDGSVHHSKIVQSSGHRSLDDTVWAYWKLFKYDKAGLLDGAPARVIVLERMNFKLKGGDSLPASFSDSAIYNLALRILKPYNSRDADALYQDIDEAAKSSMTLVNIQGRFALDTKQFGAMSYVEYKGMQGVKTVGGVAYYRLRYLVRAANPGSGSADLIVTAVDRGRVPGIMDFEVTESRIRLNNR